MIDAERVAIFSEWFRCPQCGGRNIVYAKKAARYTCRKCGCRFVKDAENRRTRAVRHGGKIE